jgi:hypothetical protein
MGMLGHGGANTTHHTGGWMGMLGGAIAAKGNSTKELYGGFLELSSRVRN